MYLLVPRELIAAREGLAALVASVPFRRRRVSITDEISDRTAAPLLALVRADVLAEVGRFGEGGRAAREGAEERLGARVGS